MMILQIFCVTFVLFVYLNVGYLFGRFNLFIEKKRYQGKAPKWLLAVLWPLTEGLGWEIAPSICEIVYFEGVEEGYLAGMAIGGWWMKILCNLIEGGIIGIMLVFYGLCWIVRQLYFIIILPSKIAFPV